MEFILILCILALYFAPAITAIYNKKRQAGAILVLNLFLGWTFIGWIAAAVWASAKD